MLKPCTLALRTICEITPGNFFGDEDEKNIFTGVSPHIYTTSKSLVVRTHAMALIIKLRTKSSPKIVHSERIPSLFSILLFSLASISE